MAESPPLDDWDDDDDLPRGGPRVGIVVAGVTNLLVGLLSAVCGIVLMANGDWVISLLTGQAVTAGATADQVSTVRRLAEGAAPAIAMGHLLFGVCALVAGFGVLQRRAWGRGMSIVLATAAGVLAILGVLTMNPVGVVIHGAYGLIITQVLNDKDYLYQFR